MNLQFLQEAVKARLEKEAEKLVAEAKQKLEERTPEIVAGVVVDIMAMTQMEETRDRVVFTFRKPGEPIKP